MYKASHLFSCKIIVYALLWLLTAGSPTLFAQDATGLWSSVPEAAVAARGARYTLPQKYRTFALNKSVLGKILSNVPKEANGALRSSTAIISLPMPDGSLARFRFVETATMAPELAARFPQIRTFTGIGVDDRSLSATFDFTPAGFHGMIHSPEEGLSFIDPFSQGDTENYQTYAKKDYAAGPEKAFIEEAVEGTDSPIAKQIAAAAEKKRIERMTQASGANEKPSGDQLRTYRVAIAATGEYTTFHGGTVAKALAAINTTLNRVNFIYIREVAIRMKLVANNTNIIWTNAATDPYTNGSPGTMINQNQTSIDARIGSSKYDIGHVFGTNSGGLAGLGVVCLAGNKARGVTGSGAPVGDAFDVDYVAHEMGHQFGANHTFNGNAGSCAGNRAASAAYEPGSGSTIMAYAGICGAQDLQPNSDAYFHTKSYDEIFAYSELNGGSGCAVITNPINAAPVPTIVTTNNLTIPRSTPFTITGSATDSNNDPITYCWEQFNLGDAGAPNAPVGNAPIFRSFKPTSSESRTFPKLSDLLNNTQTIGEILPSYTRTLRFNLTVRDNYSGGGGVNWVYPLNVNVDGTKGPFRVTSPNTALSWTTGTAQTVTWSVAGSNLAPVSCANVKVSLSINGGLSFPIVLVASTPNDGSQSIVVPNNVTNLARIKVEAVGNIFFDISNTNFSIVAPPPPIISSFAPSSAPVGAGVAIKGSNFASPITVRFNGIVATNVSLESANLVVATVPAGATTGKIQVVSNGVTTTSVANLTVGPVTSAWKSVVAVPNARGQHGAISVASNGKIYVFGGTSNGSDLLNSMQVYNTNTSAWAAGAPMPTASRGFAYAIGSDKFIYTFGGYGTGFMNQSYRLKPLTNSWTARANIPTAVWEGAATATNNGKIYVLGGQSADGVSNLNQVYTIATNSWATVAPMPVGMMQHRAVTGNNGKIYVFGGRTSTSGGLSDLVQIYSPSSNSWSFGKSMPIPKNQFGTFLNNDGRIYIIGGKASYYNNSGPFYHTVEIYNPSANTWSVGPALIAPVGEMATVNSSGNGFLMGGSNGTYRNFNWRLVLPPAAPSSLVAIAASSSQINLTYNDNSGNESRFELERASSAAGPWTLFHNNSPNHPFYNHTGLTASTTIYYRVKACNSSGCSSYSNVTSATTFSSRDEVARKSMEPELKIEASPNPFAEKVTLRFTVEKTQGAKLEIFDLKGVLISKLFDEEAQAGQEYQVEWDASQYGAGFYISRLASGDKNVHQKLLLQR
jgi:N-acetylneuraminic acid mutarotase